MILKKEAVRSYRWDDATLKQVGSQVLTSIDRDFSQFEAYGFDVTKRNAYQTALTDFSNCHVDEELEGEKIFATEEKDKAREALLLAILEVTNRANIAFANSKGRMHQFGRSDISRTKEAELSVLGKLVHKSGQRFFTELSPHGLTNQILTNLKTACEDYDEALLDRYQAKSDRNASAAERINFGNILYSEITKACEIGKSIWRSTNEALYNDYVLHPASQSNTPDPTPDTSTTTTPPPTN